MSKAKATVLVVDDEPDMLDTFKSILKKRYDLILALSGKEAIEKAREEKIDLILLDIRMPDMDGIETLKELKSLGNGFEVIMVSALHDLKLAVSSIKLGAYDYVGKPFEVEDLLAVMEKARERTSLLKQNAYLKSVVDQSYGDLIAESPAMREVCKIIDKVAEGEGTVLITGESGTGKELAAKIIHEKSKRKNRPFVVVNCAAIPENLLESELFGHERGSFTGALERKPGKFELADSGTLFLDEIGCLSLPMQAKLLRILEDGLVNRVGGLKPIAVDVRIIAATNVNLKEAVKENRFREDLFYRLHVLPIEMPPLRKRLEDLPILAEFFREKANRELNRQIKGFSKTALQVLKNYPWPGNVRELENLVERLVTLGKGEYITEEQLPLEVRHLSVKKESLKEALAEFERDHILRALAQVNHNQSHAAKRLGIHRTTLISRMQALGIKTLNSKP